MSALKIRDTLYEIERNMTEIAPYRKPELFKEFLVRGYIAITLSSVSHMTHLSGGCLCEKVRYKISLLPISQGTCYCHQCQKTGGACGSPLMVLHKNALEYPSIALAFCITKSDRGSTVTRNFCGECGRHIFSQISDVPEIITQKAASLDNFSNFTPEYLVWTGSASPSCAFPNGIPSFMGGAPLEIVLGRK